MEVENLLEQVEKVGGVRQEEGGVALEKHLNLLARNVTLQQIHLIGQIFLACFTILDFDVGSYTKLIMVATNHNHRQQMCDHLVTTW